METEDNSSGAPFENAFKRLRVNEDTTNNAATLLNTMASSSQGSPKDAFTTRQIPASKKDKQVPLPLKDNEDQMDTSTQQDSVSTDSKNPSNATSSTPQNCSHEARNEPDVTVDELAGYLDVQLFLPKKMSFMAELMYT